MGTIGEAAFFSSLLLIGFAAAIALVASQVIAIPGVPRTSPGSGLWLGLLVSVSLALIGAGGFLRTVMNFGASVERRAVLAQKAKELDPRPERKSVVKNFPTIPCQDSLLLSPGTRLRYRLPLVASPMWTLLALVAYALLWNGLFMAVIVTSVKGFQAGQPRWFATFLLVPLIYMAVTTTRDFLERLIDLASIGPTSAEVSDLPLVPGGEYQLCIVQAGRGQLRSLETRLICEEQATFCQGTNVRTERRDVYDKVLFQVNDLAIRQNEPHVHLEQFEVPLNAMHSVKLANNAINWRLVVQGHMQRGASFRRSFPVVVFPTATNVH